MRLASSTHAHFQNQSAGTTNLSAREQEYKAPSTMPKDGTNIRARDLGVRSLLPAIARDIGSIVERLSIMTQRHQPTSSFAPMFNPGLLVCDLPSLPARNCP